MTPSSFKIFIDRFDNKDTKKIGLYTYSYNFVNGVNLWNKINDNELSY